MGKSATNISIVLGIITVAYAGYYLYTQYSSTIVLTDVDEQVMLDMQKKTQAFIQYDNTLNMISLDLSFFEDKRLLRLRQFTTEITDRSVGRPDPFADVEVTNELR